MRVEWDDLLNTFKFVGFGYLGDHQAMLCKFFCRSELYVFCNQRKDGPVAKQTAVYRVPAVTGVTRCGTHAGRIKSLPCSRVTATEGDAPYSSVPP